MDKKKLKGACGLRCDQCPAFIAHKTNDDSLREKTANEWSLKYGSEFNKEMINCKGCLSNKEPLCGYCKMCPVRNCVNIKKFKHCFLCNDYEKCLTRKDFETMTNLNIRDLGKL